MCNAYTRNYLILGTTTDARHNRFFATPEHQKLSISQSSYQFSARILQSHGFSFRSGGDFFETHRDFFGSYATLPRLTATTDYRLQTYLQWLLYSARRRLSSKELRCFCIVGDFSQLDGNLSSPTGFVSDDGDFSQCNGSFSEPWLLLPRRLFLDR